MKTYNKLVRDKIPEIIKQRGAKAVNTKILNDEEYLISLNKKLEEELNEYLSSGEIEELADLEEVLRAILDIKHITYSDFEKIRQNKKTNVALSKTKSFLKALTNKRSVIWITK